MRIVNLTLAKHPINWLIVWSMALLLFFVGHLLISYFTGQHPGAVSETGPGTSQPSA